ncbi:DUF6942 family protein [Shewanella morhuae]|uniref:Uncharacterized protein n=1 Tax=Shewanella morhuae TaxID=365591 RepID=A0A380A1T8_9GAMM|nr:hypothetical protein [Shewanella morhuae]GIU05554.1 hypothetical protein TUM4641_15370 [Shewanella morhuae]SUI72800.1 Uncharacterised protein [Shewanella morhuae]
MIIGHPQSQFAYYLPTPPLIPDGWHYSQVEAIAALIALNGNHWRKIFTIMAKISLPEGDWRHYRDQTLLKRNEMICIGGTELIASAKVHIVAGQMAAHRLGLSLATTDYTNAAQLLSIQHKSITFIKLPTHPAQYCLLTPYLDYRQYPNQLIELTRQQIMTL